MNNVMKRHYGKFGHVRLTYTEYVRLIVLCKGNEKKVEFLIEDLDTYLEHTPDKREGKSEYKSHYRVIRRRRKKGGKS